ncbi:MAG: polysaccharide deacetylase family protein [Bryobacteraceae bacterium]|nr:polysaccharide deacetylase family protein [Bryobacteraceae bacterium]
MRRYALLTAFGAVVAAQGASFPWPNGAKAAVCLTYDDGVDIHLDHAVPDLEAANLRGTFYVPGSSNSLDARMDEWREIGRRGHEIGNHAVFHPCLRVSAKGARREWLQPERELERYTVRQMIEELRAMNTTLTALDGGRVRTYAYNCSDWMAGGESFIDPLRPLFVAARGGEDEELADPWKVDVHYVPSWMVRDVSGERMIALVRKAIDTGALAVFMFHGVGGGHSIDISREAHRELLGWLDKHREVVWTDTFRRVMEHVIAERKRSATR